MILTLSPSQAKIAIDRHRFRVLNCGRRFGKTTLAVEEIKGKVAAGKKHIAYIAPTYQQARDIAWELLKKEFLGAYFNEARLEVRVNDCIIVLRGWESVETLRGQTFDFIVIDEVAMMRNFWVDWQEVIRPTLTDTKGHVLFISTPKGFNFWYDLYNLERTDPDYKSFHFTSYDNPHIPKDEIDKAKSEVTEDRFAQEYLADFRKTEGLVYKEFDRKQHIYETLPQGKYVKIGGIDFGFVNPAVVLHIYADGEDYWIEDEWYKRGKTEDQIAEYVSACDFEAVYPDPENPSAIAQLERARVNVREVIKGKDSVQSGIQMIRELLKQGRLYVNQRCLNLIHEFETYSYGDETADRNANEKPVKLNDHCVDALRYVVMMRNPREEEKHFRGIDGASSSDPYERSDARYGFDQGVFIGTDGSGDNNPY